MKIATICDIMNKTVWGIIMAETKKSNVGVVLVNDLGLYNTRFFIPLQRLQGKREDMSFLIINLQYVNNTNSKLTPPKEPFDNNWRPPEYGKPLFLIKENRVPAKLAKLYLDTYSLDGKFGKIADLGYICVPDIEKVCKYISSPNPIIQRQAAQILERDKTVIDLLYTALELQDDIQDQKLREKTTQSIFLALVDGLKGAPLSHKFDLPKVLTSRTERLKLAQGSEQKYAEITQTAAKNVFLEGRSLAYPQPSQSR